VKGKKGVDFYEKKDTIKGIVQQWSFLDHKRLTRPAFTKATAWHAFATQLYSPMNYNEFT